MVFDKTGTLTAGKPVLLSAKAIYGQDDAMLELAAAIQQNSSHPLAKAVVDQLAIMGKTPSSSTSVKELPGRGLQGQVDSKMVYVGNERWMVELGIDMETMTDISMEFQNTGKTISCVAVRESAAEPSLLGMLVFGDEIKHSSKQAISGLRLKNIKTLLLTGDNRISAEHVAQNQQCNHGCHMAFHLLGFAENISTNVFAFNGAPVVFSYANHLLENPLLQGPYRPPLTLS